MDGLEIATTEELLGELAKRFTGLVVGTLVAAKDINGYDDTLVWYYGGLTLAMGITRRINLELDRDALGAERSEPETPGEGTKDDEQEV